jgi:acetyl-CoA acyltransferase
VHPVDLGALVLSALLERNGLESTQIDDVLMGCVSQIGDQSVNLARNAVLAAGFDEHVPATTIDRQCGSSQQAAHFAAQGVIAGAYDIVIAGGVESMSRVPLGSTTAGGTPTSPKLRERYPDGLVNQGVSAELIAAKWGFDRDTLDAFSAESHRRAAAAWDEHRFDRELIPVPTPDGEVSVDETVRAGTTTEKLAGLAASFRDERVAARFPQIDWNITPGNSSPLTDGASALLIMSEDMANGLGLTPRARFHSFAVTGDDPLYMLTGPIPATKKILDRSGLSIDDIDAYEVNEAFAPVPLAWARETGADPAKLNPWGGAIALGHPLGATGTRLMGTLLAHLEATGGRYGLQTMCEGGGMANATIIERL